MFLYGKMSKYCIPQKLFPWDVDPPWDGGIEVCSNDPDHITKMATMPICGKKIKNLLLWNRLAIVIETWYTASDTQVLSSLFK